MSDHWQLLYQFTLRPVEFYVMPFALGAGLFIGGFVGLHFWIIGKSRPLTFLDWDDFRELPLLGNSIPWREEFVLCGICFGLFLMVSTGIMFHSDSQLISSLRQNRCNPVRGRISSIMPAGRGGERQFVIGNQTIIYDNHAVGFNDNLCDGVRLCADDYGRLCMDGKWIGRIEKWVGPSGSLP